MNDLEKKFYLEVKDAIKHFAQYTIEDIKGSKDTEFSAVKKELEEIRKLNLSDSDLGNLQKIIEDVISGTVHSIFVSIDGGTAISDEGKALELIDKKAGNPITQGALHENFMDVFDK
jgi:hypothetical protein